MTGEILFETFAEPVCSLRDWALAALAEEWRRGLYEAEGLVPA